MRRLPKPPAELVGLPGWPLLLTERGAASYLSLSPEDFDKGVRHRELPGPRRTPGGPRWSRSDLDAWHASAGAETVDDHDTLSAAIDAAWGAPR
jgi:hypothetical protein